MAISIPHQDDSEFAVQRCRQVVVAKPRQAEARHALAVALVDAHDPAEAIEQTCRALTLKASHYPSARLLASLMRRYVLSEDIVVSEQAFIAALAFPDVDRQALCVAAIGYLKTLPAFVRALALGDSDGWDASARFLLSASGRKLRGNRLFRAALAMGVNTDVAVEFLLTALRRHLLLSTPVHVLRQRYSYEFTCALIQQCVNNEYIFVIGDDERRVLDRLEADSAANLLPLALYRPLHELLAEPIDQDWLDRLSPRALRRIVQTYFEARRTDAAGAKNIARLTDIVDQTSKRVERQYIDDPYPKWLGIQTPAPGDAQLALRENFSAAELAPLHCPFHVLIAGCGTGQQAVYAALGYGPDASVLAIDLSAPSLAYGERKAAAFGATNLRFAQADILGLNGVDRRYAVIECVGVLHHMAHPYAAWRILVDRLQPGGLMLIGLYSGISRGGIMALREDPACPGPGADDDALCAFRAVLMRRQPGEAGAELTLSEDFYIKSSFRDLALHVSERHCRISEIKEFLAAQGLRFHGFRLPETTLESFTAAFPEDSLPGELDHWSTFEREQPRTFDGMYVFWCRKQ